jgi:S1-C subfamily serine protease
VRARYLVLAIVLSVLLSSLLTAAAVVGVGLKAGFFASEREEGPTQHTESREAPDEARSTPSSRARTTPTRVSRAPTPRPATRTPAPPPPCDFATSADAVQRSTVRVITPRGTGTAFYVGEGQFLTAAHVVRSWDVVALESPWFSGTATVIGIDNNSDVALLSGQSNLKPLRWGDSSRLALAQALGVSGYPLSTAGVASIKRGSFPRSLVNEHGVEVIETDASVNPGNSGGPVFDECGRVVGLVASKELLRPTGPYAEGIAYAVSQEAISSLLPHLRSSPPPAPNCGQDSVDVQAGRAAAFDARLDRFQRLTFGLQVVQDTSGRLDIAVYLQNSLGDVLLDLDRIAIWHDEFSARAADTYRIVLDNTYSFFTPKSVLIEWCIHG